VFLTVAFTACYRVSGGIEHRATCSVFVCVSLSLRILYLFLS
jgi:hypothetical protein